MSKAKLKSVQSFYGIFFVRKVKLMHSLTTRVTEQMGSVLGLGTSECPDLEGTVISNFNDEVSSVYIFGRFFLVVIHSDFVMITR